MATHSPIVAATPGATLLEVSDDGLLEREWKELDLVQNWSALLDNPGLFFRYLDD